MFACLLPGWATMAERLLGPGRIFLKDTATHRIGSTFRNISFTTLAVYPMA